MSKKIILIGGIHGVGKGTLCKEWESKYKIPHFTASQLIKWDEISQSENKKVESFDETQNRLLHGIEKNIPNNKLSLLDGHFCLLNKLGLPEKIDEKVFFQICPLVIAVVTETIEVIFDRLRSRDKVEYDRLLLKQMQLLEIEHATQVSKILNIPFYLISDGNSYNFDLHIKKILGKSS